jgi:hypothetical protein
MPKNSHFLEKQFSSLREILELCDRLSKDARQLPQRILEPIYEKKGRNAASYIFLLSIYILYK